MRRLDEIGAGAPEGRRYHVGHPVEGGWEVVDVWDSPEQLDRFARDLLVDILIAVGVTPPRPEVQPIHKIIAS